MKITTLVIKLIIIVSVTIITFTIAQSTNIRCCHGSTIANNKLYIGGGITGPTDNNISSDDFFSLDLAVPFSTSSPTDMPYEEHPNVLVKSNGHALVYAVGKEGEMIYLFGGFRGDPKGELIYGYSLKFKQWSEETPETPNGMPVGTTSKIVGVTDSNLNTIFIFDNGTMHIFDVFRNILYISPDFAPYKILNYAAVTLNTDEIAYIGGSNGTNNIPMNQILLYNTKISTWYTRNANGRIPSPRQGHSASIAPDGRIFVYGGFDGNDNATASNESDPIFAVLEYVNGELTWSTPQLFGQLYQFRIYHTSHVFENYLIITFGQNLTHNRINTIDIIDISNRDIYNAVKDFVPLGYVPPTPQQSTSNKNIIIASALGSVGLLIIIGCTFFLIRRYYRNRNVIPTPGEERI
ncbi:hypothetical protein RhiirA1_490216 [Rhizophagus irregularis]|uniref:Galactose oxidase n=1 Tax=Rhizophagus irregularis TaxID=588596 RepID=A0A2I1EAT5_9GLOM|nr:hypothetical protein RhiirA1_490216 [Rhizophagus irregularis]PKY19222.1 hypothetical protein RhiirB3_493903 [Rhizophagus irregularis]CAB4470912.1 unnamed protein product [Rhizophagus irregularis]CAB5378408.1 unnamed protein product [Rhizophagus irregularis]